MADTKATAYTKADLARDLHEVAITLENDGGFYKEFVASASSSTPADQRSYIRDAARRLCGEAASRTLLRMASPGAQVWEGHEGVFLNREHVRRCLVDGWNCPAGRKDRPGDVRDPPPFEFWLDSVKFPTPVQPKDDAVDALAYASIGTAYIPVPQLDPQDPTMNTPAIEVTTKTLVNGADVASLPDSAIYSLIADQEAEIKKLQAIENKPKRLVAEIEKRQAGIAALVAHLDSKAD